MIIIFVSIVSIILLYYIYKRYTRIEYFNNENTEIKNELLKFVRNVTPELYNKITINIGDQSATFNKKDIYICIKDKNGNIYPLYILYNVLLHELAHVNTKTFSGYDNIEHDSNHYNELQRLNNIAINKGYLFIDIDKVPEDYCKI